FLLLFHCFRAHRSLHSFPTRRSSDLAFNRLILLAGIHWREAALLRALGRYIKQIRMGFELPYIAATLANHAPIARELVRLFKTRFFLARKPSAGELEQKLEQAILSALDGVAVLNEDRSLGR